ncbi:MAG: DNA translocase FtsK 4TM domain-containing protein [Victivallaceae bacterium]|nr:DNA translocase FtsK 4TM domain-containing protein [Victivallaceae bacterium]
MISTKNKRKDDGAGERNLPQPHWIVSILATAATLLLLFALLSHDARDISIIKGGIVEPCRNYAGYLGAKFSYHLLKLIGLSAYIGTFLILFHMLRRFFSVIGRKSLFWGGFFLVLLGTMWLFAMSPRLFATWMSKLGLGSLENPELSLSGGLLGQWFAAPAIPGKIAPGWLLMLIGAPGLAVLSWALVACGFILIGIGDLLSLPRVKLPKMDFHLPRFVREKEEDEDDGEEEVSAPAPRRVVNVQQELPPVQEMPQAAPPAPPATPIPHDDFPEIAEIPARTPQNRAVLPTPPQVAAPVAEKPLSAVKMPAAPPELGVREVASGERVAAPRNKTLNYELPSINLLAKGTDSFGEDPAEIAKKRDILQKTLDDFAIPGRVSGFITGPRVTRFEITLDPGVNVKKVEQIQDNITMALAATSVRVLAPIPGRPVVGVEISNHRPEAVFMRSVLESEAWQNGKAEIPLALGKDVSGKPVVLDLAKAPHLLIAGSTGTGKSVCSNSLIVSLLYHFRPDELKLIMVDPKVVEFEDYRKLPHLLTPIINDSSKVPIALRWAVNEMEKRYRILARAGVKKLVEFNRRPTPSCEEFDDNGLPIPEKMPYLVIIIDELADLMMTDARKDVETAITRIAQKGRAAGVHIVVATQRPSTNIITGVIKANLPTRFCFQVRSMTDSRVVLDTNGAEKLLGTGDMLLMSPSSMLIERIQGAWTKDEDIKTVVKFVSSQAEQEFDDSVVCEEVKKEDGEADDDDDYVENPVHWDLDPVVKKYLKATDDDTIRQALEVVVSERKVSTSYLQRRLKIGYNRAAEIIDILEERGIVGPPSGSGNKREILILDDLINHTTEI